MPINHPLTQHHSFGPDELTVLATTFDAAILELGLGRTNSTALLVAKRIIALAQGGERDPIRLREGSDDLALPSCSSHPASCGLPAEGEPDDECHSNDGQNDGFERTSAPCRTPTAGIGAPAARL
jgi:hypothetical protein